MKMPKRKPKVDELRWNLKLIDKLMGKYKRIGLFSLPKEGKSTIIQKLREKYSGTEWSFYNMTENITQEPFVYAFVSTDLEDLLPEMDIIFCLQYSQDYKESVSGVVFPDGVWRPLGDYMALAEYNQMGTLNIQGKYVKSIDDLKKLLSGENV